MMPEIEGWHMARSCTCICTTYCLNTFLLKPILSPARSLTSKYFSPSQWCPDLKFNRAVFYWSPKVVSVWWDWNNLVPPILNRDNIFKAWKKLNHFISLQKERKTFQVCAQRPVPSFSNANNYPQPPISEWSVGWDGSKMYSCSQAVALKSLSPLMIGGTGLHGGTSLFEP